MIPVVLNSPESMIRVRVMTVKDYVEKTLKTLHRIGVLHVEEAKELKPVDKATIEREHRQVGELLALVNEVLGYLPPEERTTPEEDIEVIYTRPLSEIGDEVRLLYNKTSQPHEKIVKLNDEVQRLTGLRRYLEPLAAQAGLRLKDLSFSGDYLFSRVFVLPDEAYRSLPDELKNRLFLNVVAALEGETVLHIIAEVKDQKTIESQVTEAGGRVLNIPDEDLALPEFIKKTADSIRRQEEELAGLGEKLQSQAREGLNRLVLLREVLAAENERLAVLEKASEARYVTLIEGWMPEKATDSAIAEVRENIDYVFIDTRKPEAGEEPPTKLKNPAGLKPFQTIVNLFATPKYGGWDPTPIVAYSFALFFGIMVCDVVYALGIMLLGAFLLGKFVDDPHSDNFKLFQRLIYFCSGVALVGGLLTGQYLGDIYTLFGIKNLALVQGIKEALQEPVSFILIALGIGFVHVNIGHLLALIRGIKEKNRGLIINKIGLFVLQLGLPSVLNSLLSIELPGFTPQIYAILLYPMAAGVLLVVASSIIQNGALGAILWLFDITGLLGDVMSYARLAGVGLATFYLASTFNMMAGLFGQMIPGTAGVIIGGIMGFIILVFGHLVNMVLTAITGFMHSLRLCFVEFLFKFYEGGGREYSPFRLKKRAAIPLTIRP